MTSEITRKERNGFIYEAETYFGKTSVLVLERRTDGNLYHVTSKVVRTAIHMAAIETIATKVEKILS